MGGKMAKQTKGGCPFSKMKKDSKERYYRAEFQSMGDVLKDHHLNESEFSRLMVLLGLPEADKAVPLLWKKEKKADAHGRMSEAEYVTLMSIPEVEKQTSRWRDLFSEFDTDGSGWATHEDFYKGLAKLGVPRTAELDAKIQAMDSDRDNHIHYGDFLKMQLLHKNF